MLDFTESGVGMDLSIIMINHNTKTLTAQAITSIVRTNPQISFEIIVVDNSDILEETYHTTQSNVIVLANVENKGFAHGCNTGAAIAKGEYLLFLNSDTIMQPNTLDASVQYLRQNPIVGGLGIQVLLSDGSLDHACRRGFPTPWNAFCYFSHLDKLFPKIPFFNGYRLNHLNQAETHRVDAVTGAYLMMPTELYRTLDGFDETYFMYGEDLDLCWRIKQAGYDVVYYASVTCLHLKGQSGRASYNLVVQYHFYNAMLIFYDRYYVGKYPNWLTNIIKWAIRKKLQLLTGGVV